jgi:dTDP-glucose pyrophosphorylase
MLRIEDYTISVNASARDALKMLEKLSEADTRTLFVLDNKKLVGTLTDGDIRRGLLGEREISDGIMHFMNKQFRSISKDDISPENLARLKEKDIWFLPVVNEAHEIDNIINLRQTRTVIPASAMIMAGGKGERLRPLTDSLPKPMLKVGNKPIIEINIDRLISFGIKKFYISLKYLGEKIVEYLGDGSAKDISIEYIYEDEPLGTLGACSMIKNLEHEHLIVMNSDLLSNIDFEDFFNYYSSNDALMCVASVPYTVAIPYGIMNMNGDNCITGLEEKPTYTYYANAGIYLLNKKLIKRIPVGVKYNATDLMQLMIDDCERLVHYPILQYWLDIGKYEDYVRAQQDYKHITF